MPVYLFVYSSFVLAQISDYSTCHSLFGGTLRSTHWDPDRFNFMNALLNNMNALLNNTDAISDKSKYKNTDAIQKHLYI